MTGVVKIVPESPIKLTLRKMDGNTLMVINASRLFCDTPVNKVRLIKIAPSVAHINLVFA